MTKTGDRYGDGRYEISRAIASGGMAEVFLGKDRLLDRQVAIKILHPEYARDSAFIQRFRREAQAAASLNDPRVVSVFDWGSDDGVYYLVMEYVPGRSLREILDSEGMLLPERAAEICIEVCTALQLAHRQGIVHRDIKPANILLSSGGQTKVMDFGIARAARDAGQTVTQTGTVIGTAAYLSPEQAQGLPVDSRSDVYSTAIVLYEMLTGDVPFKADSPVGVAYKHVREDPEPPSRVNRDVPSELDAIVMKGLAKNPENRYSSADDMSRDLRRWLNGEEIQATPLLAGRSTRGGRAGDETRVVSRDDGTRVMAPAESGGRGARALIYTLTFLLFLGLLIAGVALAFSFFGPGGATVEVPNLVGEHVDEADRVLKARGLDSEVLRREFSETVPALHVISHDPEDGRKVKEGSTISLVVSKGPERVEVPDVVGRTEDEAKKLITEAGLEPEVRSEVSKDVEAGRVISQDPPKGRNVERGSTVVITVSSGKATAKVPDVKGFTEERAKEFILGRSLNPVVKKVCRTSERDDRVISQEPEPNTEVPEGSDVTITVNDNESVPSVVGQSEASARAELEAEGFKVDVKRRFLTPGKQDVVVTQTPAGGDTACPGDTVTIEVED